MLYQDCTSNQVDTCSPSASASYRKFITRIVMIALIALIIVPSLGCRRIRNMRGPEAVLLSYRDMVWSKRAFNLRYGNCNRPYADHFSAGFCQGYTDTCNGGDGYIPALPPENYRDAEFRSEDGQKCVKAWFEGYPQGVAAARKDGVGQLNDVLISRMIDKAITQQKAENVLPHDVPVVGSQSSDRANGIPAEDILAPPAPVGQTSWLNPVDSQMQESDADALPPITTRQADRSHDNTPLPMAVQPETNWQTVR